MSHTTRTITTHTLNTDKGDFPVIFEPVDDSEVVKVSEDGKKAVVAYLSRDVDPESPRTAYDNVGTMVCWHGRYTLGDEQRTDDASEFFKELACNAEPGLSDKIERWENRGGDEANIRAWVLAALQKHYVMLPLFLYDHSGITMSTGSFIGRAQHAEWDSGQVGWIYASREKVLHEWGGKAQRMTKEVVEKAENYLKGEVETYDQYLTGDVYGVCSQLYVNVAEEGDEPEWEAYEEHGIIGYSGNPAQPITGDMGRDECWGYYGEKYAQEEVESLAKSYEEWLKKPLTRPGTDRDGTDIAECGNHTVPTKEEQL